LKESSLSERIYLLRQLSQLNFKSIDFSGGEPLLYEDLPYLVGEAHNLGFFTSLTTNGTLYLKFANKLKGNLSELKFSLQAADEEIHNNQRGINCYKDVIKSIIYARKLNEKVIIKSIIKNEYIELIPDLIKLSEKYGIPIELSPEFEYFGNQSLTIENLNKLMKFAKHSNVILNLAYLKFFKDGGNNNLKPLCQIGRKVLVLTPDNRIYSPCFHHEFDLIPIINLNLKKTLEAADFKGSFLMAGHYYFCNFCKISCYFEPIFYIKPNKYFVDAYISKLNYNIKNLILRFKRNLIDRNELF